MQKFTPEIEAELKSYVYLLIDPETKEPFYIGKGVGNRVFQHFDDDADSDKVRMIQALREKGLEPVVELLRYGLTDKEAALVEASAIDLIGVGKLTNIVRGQHSNGFGRESVREIISRMNAEPAGEISEGAVLIIINRLYRSDMTPDELYEATRGLWRIGPNRDQARLAMAVYKGVIKEVYRIGKWVPATDAYVTRSDVKNYKDRGRWEFHGHIAEEPVRGMYVGKSVRHILGSHSQNPIRYVNIHE